MPVAEEVDARCRAYLERSFLTYASSVPRWTDGPRMDLWMTGKG